ncbi:hypothetical protein EYF80_015767 [Liparis tanakae]|uniref:Uncharacterized protein n=1 Tax=Liparis tanakae TaxID=230148 RepID=A0A4Z2I7D6_9TELE|nr:hypothetical protein EYF80_015767 [Liparis tanakae]
MCRQFAGDRAHGASNGSGTVGVLSFAVIPLRRRAERLRPSRLLQSAGCCGKPPPAAGPSSESNWEKEEQQSSFRAQISKIEHFLNTERLRLTKRRRTDD